MRKLRAADLFCGGGGTTTGAEASGFVKVVLAVNHWRTAIQTHRQNHPHVRHICARIDDIDPRHDATIPELDLLMASPECTHHSIARGGKPIDDQKRATPWHVCVWAEAKRPARPTRPPTCPVCHGKRIVLDHWKMPCNCGQVHWRVCVGCGGTGVVPRKVFLDDLPAGFSIESAVAYGRNFHNN